MKAWSAPAAALALTLSACVAAPAPSVAAAPWRPVNAETGKITDLEQLKSLAAAFPESASVQRRLLSAAANAGDAALVRQSLGRLEAMGYALRPQTFDALAKITGEAEASAARVRADAARQRVGVSTVFATVPPNHKLTEGVAWDVRNHRLFVSSVVDRQVLRMDDNRGIPIAGLDAGSVSGLAIDQHRRLLWISSGVVEQTPRPEAAFRGLIAVDLDRLTPARRVAAPAGAEFPSDNAVATDGTVYVSDAMGGGLYRLRPGADEMDVLVAPGILRSPQGIAVNPDGDRLYVADYSYGIAIVDTGSGVVSRLEAEQPMMLDGVDGLYWFEGQLIAIQNGTSPLRIMRIRLDPSGTRAVAVSVVEANHPDWGEPTIGQISEDGALIYVSDPQWDRFGEAGRLKGEAPLRPNTIRITPLREGGEPPPRQ